ncbi:UNVERIFIED_CONTAM: hypothetical protein FKN15_073190, partial [Acipenser sinensis]
VKPSKPRCWLEGKLLEGNDVTLGCGSADGTDPITYKWERVPEKGKSLSYLPSQSRIGKNRSYLPPQSRIGKSRSYRPPQSRIGKNQSYLPPQSRIGKSRSYLPSQSHIGKSLSYLPSQSRIGKNRSYLPPQSRIGKNRSYLPPQSRIGKSRSYLPPQSRIDLNHPEIVILRNLTMDSIGTYQCTASNEAGQDSCIIQVTMHYVRGVGVVAGAVVGVVFGVLCIVLVIWLILRKKEKRKYEEEETPNEIREDAEAPKAKLMKPNSSTSSRSGSSRSGASSTQSIVHNSTTRSQRLRPAATLKENGEPPTYSQVVSKEPEPEPEPDTGKISDATPERMGATSVMIPAQSRAFQTV